MYFYFNINIKSHTLSYKTIRPYCFKNKSMLLRVGDDVEDGPDADEHAAQHRAQLRLQVEARHLAQQRVVARHVCCKLQTKKPLLS
jgi:hypothetical protein